MVVGAATGNAGEGDGKWWWCDNGDGTWWWWATATQRAWARVKMASAETALSMVAAPPVLGAAAFSTLCTFYTYTDTDKDTDSICICICIPIPSYLLSKQALLACLLLTS